jgi:hypothetical protein
MSSAFSLHQGLFPSEPKKKILIENHSACVYPEYRQTDEANPGLKESDAWPAQPQVR